MSEARRLFLGSKDDYFLNYGIDIDRMSYIYSFGWYRYSYGHFYGDTFDFDSRDKKAVEDFSLKNFVKHVVQHHHDATYDQLFSMPPPLPIGKVTWAEFNHKMTSTDHAWHFKTFDELKTHFFANPKIPECLKK